MAHGWRAGYTATRTTFLAWWAMVLEVDLFHHPASLYLFLLFILPTVLSDKRNDSGRQGSTLKLNTADLHVYAHTK